MSSHAAAESEGPRADLAEPRAGRGPAADRPPARRRVVYPALAVAAVIALFVIGSFLPPSNPLGMLGGGVWTFVGPHLVLLSAACGAVAVFLMMRRRRSVAIVATAVAAAIALVGSTAITARFVSAVDSAGGSVNPVRALFPSMSKPDAAVTTTFETIDGPDQDVAIYLPSEPVENAPVIYYIHGGGWVTGDIDDGPADYQWFADQGYVFVSAGYRLASAEHAAWDEAPQDVACGLAWTADNIAEYGGDPARIVVMGGSAGGNLAVNLGYGAATGDRVARCGDAPVTVPAAVVTQYPVVSPLNAYDEGKKLALFDPREFTSQYIGGEPREHLDRIRAITSSTYISADAPPTLIVSPQADPLIPAGGITEFARQAELAGVDVTVASLPTASHVFDGFLSGSIGSQAARSISLNYLTEMGLGG